MSNIHTEIDEVFAEYEKLLQWFQKPYTDLHIVTDRESLITMRDTLQEITKLMKSLEVDY